MKGQLLAVVSGIALIWLFVFAASLLLSPEMVEQRQQQQIIGEWQRKVAAWETETRRMEQQTIDREAAARARCCCR